MIDFSLFFSSFIIRWSNRFRSPPRQEDGKQTKLAAKYLTCLRRSVENMEKVKIFPDSIRGQQIVPLSDLPAIYQGKPSEDWRTNCT